MCVCVCMREIERVVCLFGVCVYVCVRVCARERERVCVCVCACECA